MELHDEVKKRANVLASKVRSEHERCNELHGQRGFELYKAQSSDVVVNSFMKSGTTLMQQLVYQLLCATGRVTPDPDGELFDDISEVVPFIEVCHLVGWENPRNTCFPRCFKSHAQAELFDGTQRYIVCLRDGRRVGASLFDFAFDWLVPEARTETAEIRNEAFRIWTDTFYLDTAMWFKQVRSWIDAARNGWNILFLQYDDMCADLQRTIGTVAKFLDVKLNDEVLKKVEHKCSRQNMVGDKRFLDTIISNMMGWDTKFGSRVRPIDAKSFKDTSLSEDTLKQYQRLYEDVLEVKNYDELKQVTSALSWVPEQ